MLKDNKIWLATRNYHKLKEARLVLEEFNINLEHLSIDRVEIQADELGEIAAYSLRQIPDDGLSIAIEDAGLFINNFRGFPGPYSSYALTKIDNPGILKLMEGVKDRRASYHSSLAFRHLGEIKIFKGLVEGEIAHSMRGTKGFGFDPIFIPSEGDGRTFGEMLNEEKNAISHRARSFQALAQWIQSLRDHR